MHVITFNIAVSAISSAVNRLAFNHLFDNAALTLNYLGYAAFARLIFHIDRAGFHVFFALVHGVVRYRRFRDMHRTAC